MSTLDNAEQRDLSQVETLETPPPARSRSGLLPPELRFAHRFSHTLLDRLDGLREQLDDDRFWSLDLWPGTEEQAAELAAIEDNADLLAWLAAHGHEAVAAEFALRQAVEDVAATFSTRLREGLDASAQGDVARAWRLVRDPLRDDLLVLEWIVADPGGLGAVLLRHSVEDALARAKAEPGKTVRLIRETLGVLPSLSAFGAEFLHDVRFGERVEFAPATTRQGRHLRWVPFYSEVPLLLYYASQVAEAAWERVTGEVAEGADTAHVRAATGFVLWGLDRRRFERRGTLRRKQRRIDGLKLECRRCGGEIVSEWQLRRLSIRGSVTCRRCGTLQTLDEILEGTT